MDEVICALCIQSCYHPTLPLKAKQPYSGEWKGDVRTIGQLVEASAEGLKVFEVNNSMAVGVYADTFVKGIALCAMHSLFVLQSLDISRL